MFTLFVILAAVGAFTYVTTTPASRAEAIESAQPHIEEWIRQITRARAANAPYRLALAARTRWVIVTPTIMGLSVLVFVFMLRSDGSLSSPQTLLSWGGNLGQRTAGGEWWRLITALFVHAGTIPLLVHLIALAQLGWLLERLVGSITFACVYVTAGILANIESISTSPLTVHVGATDAMLGIYGLLVAVMAWGTVRRSHMTIPLLVLKALAPATVVFLIHSVVAYGITTSSMTGFMVGVVSGILLTKGIGERKPRASLTVGGFAATATVVACVLVMMPFHGLIDARPEIARVVALEDRTVRDYRSAVVKYRQNSSRVERLTELINQRIMPDFRSAHARVAALDDVAIEHRPLVAKAAEYLQLRETSWRIRAEALHKSSMAGLRDADQKERDSLEALNRLRVIAYLAGISSI